MKIGCEQYTRHQDSGKYVFVIEKKRGEEVACGICGVCLHHVVQDRLYQLHCVLSYIHERMPPLPPPHPPLHTAPNTYISPRFRFAQVRLYPIISRIYRLYTLMNLATKASRW